MDWSPDKGPELLRSAVGAFDDLGVGEQCAALISYLEERPEPYPRDGAIEVLEILRSKRRFSDLKGVAEALIEQGQRDAEIQRHYAQALIEGRDFFQAERVLEGLEREARGQRNAVELREARGLMGRLYKQRYVGAGLQGKARPDDLERATRLYLGAYREAPEENLWHGINAVALLRRAERDGVPVPDAADPLDIAHSISLAVEKTHEREPNAWNMATGMEASLATGDHGTALTWLMRYIKAVGDEQGGLEQADAFHFASTLRQLEEVWLLDPAEEPGALLIPPLEAASLRSLEGTLRRPSSQVESAGSPGQFEARHGTDEWYPMQWWRTGNRRAAAVARIFRKDDDRTHGTGFLIRGEDLNDRYGGELFVVTNCHVVSADDAVHSRLQANPPLRPHEAGIAFEVAGETRGIDAVVVESAPDEDDFAVLRLDGPVQTGEDPYPVFARPLGVGGTERIFLIGYPQGTSQLQVSFENNRLLEMNDRRLRYRTPTEGGSSGSPLFDAKWRLVGVHHFSSDEMDSFRNPGKKLAANQGVWIKRIQTVIAAERS